MSNYRFGALKCQDESSADGMFLILNSIEFTVIHQARNSRKALLDCKHWKNRDLFAFRYIYEEEDYLFQNENEDYNHWDFPILIDGMHVKYFEDSEINFQLWLKIAFGILIIAVPYK